MGTGNPLRTIKQRGHITRRATIEKAGGKIKIPPAFSIGALHNKERQQYKFSYQGRKILEPELKYEAHLKTGTGPLSSTSFALVQIIPLFFCSRISL